MTIKFRKNIKILPGIKLNLNKKGVSISAGVRGAHVTVGKRGTHATVGLPGTGLSVTKKIGGKSKKATTKTVRQEINSEPIPRLSREEIHLRAKSGDNKSFIIRIVVSILVGCIVGYFWAWYYGIGAGIGWLVATLKDFSKQIALRPAPAYKTKEAAQTAFISTLKAIQAQKSNKK